MGGEDTQFLMDEQEKGPEELTEEGLKGIKEKLDYYFEVALLAEELALKLENLKKIMTKMASVEFPEMLLKFGINKISLQSGEEIQIKDGLSVTVTDEEKFHAFLKERDEYDIVKTLISLPRAEQEKLIDIYEFLDSTEIDYEAKVDINGNTKKKYFNDLLGGSLSKEEKAAALAEGKIIPLDAISEFAKTYTYFTTKIKEPKGKHYGRAKENQAEQF